MKLRSVRTLFLSILFAIAWLPGFALAQDEPQVFLGIDVQDDPIVVGVDTTFDVDIGWANGPLGNWTHTEVYFSNGTLYGCFDTPNHGANTGGVATVSLPVQGALLTAGDYDLVMFQAANAACDDFGNSLAVGACLIGGVFDVDLCPSDGLSVINESTVTVTKTFSDDNPAEVPISLDCTDDNAVVTVDDGNADITDTAEFTVSGYVDGTTCTAIEDGVPVGYTSDNSDCVDLALVSGEDSACTIDNQQNPVNIEITKAYTEAHPVDDSEAEITLTCPTATIDDATQTTVDGVVTFVVSDFPWDGETCEATESALPGYVQTDATGCDDLTVIPTDDDPADSCTITNRPTEATFTVDKQFSDGNPVATTTAEVTCSDLGNGPGLILTGYPAASTGTIGENTDYVATVKWFDTTATCDATEIDLVGYTQDLDQSTCDDGVDVDDDTDNSCVIFNDQDPVFINADKIYSNGGGASVEFAVECTNLDDGGTVTPATDSASPGNPAIFEVNDFMWDGSTICNVTEPVAPGGYWETDNTCVDLSILPSDDPVECAITNSPTRATFRVTKVFDDGNNVDEIEVSIDCNTGLILDQDKDLSDGEWVEFVVTDFTDGVLECTITEDGQAGYTGEYDNVSLGNIISDENCAYPAESISAETPAHECLITNYPDPVDIHINKEWIFNSFGATPDIDVYFELWLSCSAPIEYVGCFESLSPGGNPEGPLGHKGPNTPYENWAYCYGNANIWGDEELYDADFHVTVIPEFPQTSCTAWERVYDDAIEVDNGCGDFTVSVNNGYDCTITNTVFFEGIPTLSQYGMALLALLMLGVGFVSFRRFS